jgi:hypothetical protein
MTNSTRSRETTSLQFGNWGEIKNLAEKDFRKQGDTPFLICNNGDDSVFLDVVTIGGVLIENVRFRPGYDPKLVIRVKKNADIPEGVLLWGN